MPNKIVRGIPTNITPAGIIPPGPYEWSIT